MAAQYIDRRRPIRRAVVAELAIAVVAPALDDARRGQRARVIDARRNRGHAAGEAAYIDRRQSTCGAAVAELAASVTAPALDAAPRDQRTATIASRRYRGHAACQAAHIDRRQSTRGGAIAKLARGVIAPALHAARRGQRAGVKAAHCNRGHTAGQATNRDRRQPIRDAAVAELADVVPAPALDAAPRDQRAGVTETRHNRGYATRQAADIDRR